MADRHHRPTPLAPIMVLTAAKSFGTGVVTNGVFFLARHEYGFSDARNFALGLLLGVMYIAGAIAVGPALQAAARRFAWLTTRAVLVVVAFTLAALCLLPQSGGEWTLWLFVAVYSPVTGTLWPIVESYLAGGRTDAQLRRVIGVFNVVWASAIAIAYLGMGPLLEHHTLTIVRALGALHALAAIALLWFHREPGKHIETVHAVDPAMRRALRTFRRLLPMSYLVLSAWSPYAPAATALVGIPVAWSTAVAGAWQFSRVIVFGVLGWWHGWHGWRPLAPVGVGLLILGFLIAVTAPIAPDWIHPLSGAVRLVGGLSAFGVGLALIYTAALYYALEAGAAGVEAGASHEALIGVGYAGGPACGLAAAGMAGGSELAVGPFFVLVAFACLGAVWAGGQVGRRHRDSPNKVQGSPEPESREPAAPENAVDRKNV